MINPGRLVLYFENSWPKFDIFVRAFKKKLDSTLLLTKEKKICRENYL